MSLINNIQELKKISLKIRKVIVRILAKAGSELLAWGIGKTGGTNAKIQTRISTYCR
ncbi:MAG TPA: hypothetical protein VK982_04305 [Bacteroidales bacterium]|nr:hypothetical protein [Bacteroidales bacterium]